MDDVNPISLDEVLAIHYDQITRYGGSHGIRSLDLLMSAISRPLASFGGLDLYPDIFSKAAAILHSLVLNHPFVDGNKRTAVVTTARFLYINGFLLKMSKKDLILSALKVASKEWKMNEISSWLKNHSKKI